MADQAANYEELHTGTALGVEGRLLWKLTTLHAKLFTACAEGNEKLVQSLLNKTPRFNVENGNGWSGMHWASNNGHQSVVSMLMRKEESILIKDRNGWTPLYAAARNRQDKIVSILLENGADANIETNSGSTALHLAAERGNISTVRSSGHTCRC